MAICAEDVSLDQIVPLVQGISIEEVTSIEGLHILGSDIIVKIKSADIDLELKLPFGSHTQEFLQRVNFSLEGNKSDFEKSTPETFNPLHDVG
ncbi:Hypothetical predicted protein [Pelobates cultripes]|uniref:INPP5B PH domain-containing protein n=2 Tax=Pelobates cultripes TaxID=61616 RepID=A0AAD1R300_PELCU|nr:Hypothetical predicted protein [Pelobates cultripes]